MTKEDIVEVLAKAGKISKKSAGDCLGIILDEIKKSLKQGKSVVLTGFGTFSVSKRKARMGRNPRTGKALKIPARKVPKFKAGKSLKDAVK
ncbi:HU family DNA-binding protein [bacterium]|nr:HU family DNA-binding protein [bacterium]